MHADGAPTQNKMSGSLHSAQEIARVGESIFFKAGLVYACGVRAERHEFEAPAPAPAGRFVTLVVPAVWLGGPAVPRTETPGQG